MKILARAKICAAHIVAPRFPLPPLTVMFSLDGQLYTVSRVLTHVHHTRLKAKQKLGVTLFGSARRH